MQSLPGALIGELGSYLCQKEYYRFSRCCRLTFLGCHPIVTLRVLSIQKVDKVLCETIDLQKFRHVRHLKLGLRHFGFECFPCTGEAAGIVCPHLNQVTLYHARRPTLNVPPVMESFIE